MTATLSAGAGRPLPPRPTKPPTRDITAAESDRASRTDWWWDADVKAGYRALGNVELRAEIESLEYVLAGLTDYDLITRDVVKRTDGRRLTLAQDELAHREQLHRSGATVADPNSDDYDAWLDLAAQVRAQADIVKWLELSGVAVKRGRLESHAACPACGGGEDRLIIWEPGQGREHGRCWCRVCGWSADIIEIHRRFAVPGSSFFEALRVLALELGLRTPDHGSARRVDLGPARPVIDLGRVR